MFIKKIKITFIFFCLLGFSTTVFGSDNQQIRTVYNAAIDAVVKEIVAMRNGYPELEGFSSVFISQDSNGFKRVSYSHDAGGGDPQQDPYGFVLSINLQSIDSKPELIAEADFQEIVFPLLGVKVVVQAHRKGVSASFDVKKIIEENMDELKDLEQNYLPFQLKLDAQLDEYHVGETIVVVASLVNKGAKAFRVADLNERSLYCLFADNVWGNPEGGFELIPVLNPGATITTLLTIPGVDTPQDMWISCQYGIAYKGVRPYKRIKVSIKPASDLPAPSY